MSPKIRFNDVEEKIAEGWLKLIKDYQKLRELEHTRSVHFDERLKALEDA